jgi:hypothetical protein
VDIVLTFHVVIFANIDCFITQRQTIYYLLGGQNISMSTFPETCDTPYKFLVFLGFETDILIITLFDEDERVLGYSTV